MKHFVKDSYFDVVNDVSDTWNRIKSLPNYKTVVGVELFTRMFHIAPDVWRQFDFAQGVKPGEHLKDNKAFVAFASNFISMLDLAIDMLGPDLELVEGQLQQLGYRHINYGVMPKHYPLMGKALLQTLEFLLGDVFNETKHDSWNSIYTFMSVTMMQGAFQELVKVEEKNKQLLAENKALKKSPKDATMVSKVDKTSQSNQSLSSTVKTSTSTHSLTSDDDNVSTTSSTTSASRGSTTKKTSWTVNLLAQRFARTKV